MKLMLLLLSVCLVSAFKIQDQGVDSVDQEMNEIMDLDRGRAIDNFRDNFNNNPFAKKERGSPCCHTIELVAQRDHGLWMIHFNKLGSYLITNTLIEGRNTWVHSKNSEFVISWCGTFWHLGHRDEAGSCNGYISSPNDALCFEGVQDIRYYVHCINEWVDAGPSGVRAICRDGRNRKKDNVRINLKGGKNMKIDPRNAPSDGDAITADDNDVHFDNDVDSAVVDAGSVVAEDRVDAVDATDATDATDAADAADPVKPVDDADSANAVDAIDAVDDDDSANAVDATDATDDTDAADAADAANPVNAVDAADSANTVDAIDAVDLTANDAMNIIEDGQSQDSGVFEPRSSKIQQNAETV